MAGVGIVVTMPVVVQAGFRVVVLPLEAQRVVDFRHFQAGDVAVGAVAGRPEDFAAVAGQFSADTRQSSWKAAFSGTSLSTIANERKLSDLQI